MNRVIAYIYITPYKWPKIDESLGFSTPINGIVSPYL